MAINTKTMPSANNVLQRLIVFFKSGKENTFTLYQSSIKEFFEEYLAKVDEISIRASYDIVIIIKRDEIAGVWTDVAKK